MSVQMQRMKQAENQIKASMTSALNSTVILAVLLVAILAISMVVVIR